MSNYEPVQPPGLSNARPRVPNASGVIKVRRGGRGASAAGSSSAANRAARIARMKKLRENEEKRKKNLEKSNSNVENEPVGTATLGLFMATSRLKESDQAVKDLKTIIGMDQFKNMIKNKTTKVGSLNYKLIEIVGKNDKLKKLFSISSEYGVVYNRRQNIPSNTIFDFKFRITDDDGDVKAGIFTLFTKSLKLMVRGGYFNSTSKNDFSGLESQPRAIARALFNMFNKKPPLPKFTLQNTVMSMRTGKKFDEKEFIRDTYGKNTIFNFKLNKKTKQSVSKVFMLLGTKGHTVSITKKGVIQVSLKKNPTKEEIKSVASKVTELKNKLSKYFKGASKVETKKRKITRRMNNQPAPNVARKGTTCPKGKRPTPYSFAGKCPRGYYVRPNPQQQPCCYKIPTNTTAYKNKVSLAYKSANVRIPNNVANMFGINRNNKNKSVNVSQNDPNIKLYKTVTRVRRANGTMVNVPNVRIGSRQCLRYTKQKILDFIARIGYTNKNLESKSKEQLCVILRSLAKNTNMNMTQNKYIPTFTYKGKPTQLTLKLGKILVIGRRECSSLSKKDMHKVCSALGIRFNETTTRPEMCKLINEKRIEMQKKLNTNKNKNISENIKKQLNRDNAARNRNIQLKVNKNKKRDKVLYQMFITKVEPYVRKYEKYGARDALPSKSEYLQHFKISVNVDAANAINNVNKKGWKKGFNTWLDQYITQFKTATEQSFMNAKQKANKNAANAKQKALNAARAKREKERLLSKLTPEKALQDMDKFKNKLPKNLHNAFNKKKNEFAKSYRKFVVLNNNASVNRIEARKRAWFSVESSSGSIRRYLNAIVNKMPPKLTDKNIRQKYELNKNLKLVLGPKVKYEHI